MNQTYVKAILFDTTRSTLWRTSQQHPEVAACAE